MKLKSNTIAYLYKIRKKKKRVWKIKEENRIDSSAVCSDGKKLRNKNRRVFSLDFKLARDSMLEEITKGFKNLWS